MHILYEIGGWPNGIIVGNLMASVVWSAVFEWRLRFHHKKIHHRLDKIEKSNDGSTDNL